MRPLLGHASHLFVGCPMLDLLQAFGAKTPRQLRRDLSPFCADQLLAIVAALQREYQDALWTGGSDADTDSSGGGGGSGAAVGMEYLAGGSVGLFSLKPDLASSALGGAASTAAVHMAAEPYPPAADPARPTAAGAGGAHYPRPAAAAAAEHLLARGLGALGPAGHRQVRVFTPLPRFLALTRC